MILKKIKFCILSITLLFIFMGIKSYVKDINTLTKKPVINNLNNTRTPLAITPTYHEDDYNNRISKLANSATVLVPETNNGKNIRYKNEADREENEVHHHYEYPESSWKQQHQTPQVILDESVLPSAGIEKPVI